MNVEELRRLEAKATPGPWKTDGAFIENKTRIVAVCYHQENCENDAALIAAMHTALPELLKALEKAQKRNAVMENALTNISMMHDGNPPLVLADIPEVDYARRVITTMRLEARHALPPHGGVDVD